jgi:hypothetical protein
MSEVGDLDEAGRFCIDGRDIVCEGPMTSYDLNDVIRDAVMRGGGDIWKVPDFLAAYTDKNTRKPMYKRVEAPMDGFLKSFPTRAVIFSTTNFTAVLNMESIIDSGSTTSSQTTKTK